MTLRLLLLALLLPLLLAPSALGQYVAIVPVAGAGRGIDLNFGSYTWVTNAAASPATIHVKDTYFASPGQTCAYIPPPQTVKPGQTVFYGPLCGPLFAFTIESDQPIIVRNELAVGFWEPACGFTFGEESVDVPSEYLPGGRDVAIPRIFIGDLWRSNLFVLNPNDKVIDIDLHLSRTDFEAVADRRVSVAAHSIAMFPLAEVEGTPVRNGWDDGTTLNGGTNVTLRSTGAFLAGVSSLRGEFRQAVYRNPILLGR